MKLASVSFSAAFYRVSNCGLLYKLRFIGVGGSNRDKSIVSEFLSDRRQRVRLDGKISDLVDVVSGCKSVGF